MPFVKLAFVQWHNFTPLCSPTMRYPWRSRTSCFWGSISSGHDAGGLKGFAARKSAGNQTASHRQRFPVPCIPDRAQPLVRDFPLFGFTARGRSQEGTARDQLRERTLALVPSLPNHFSLYMPNLANRLTFDPHSLHYRAKVSQRVSQIKWLTSRLGESHVPE